MTDAVPEARAVLAYLVAAVVSEGEGAPTARTRRLGEGYAGSDVVAGRVLEAGATVAVRFDFGTGTAVDCIELAIPSTPGQFRIHALRVDGRPVPDLGRRVLLVRDQHLGGDDGQLVYGSAARAPTIELDLRGLVADTGPSAVEVRVSRDGAAAVDGGAARQEALRDLQDAIRAQAGEVMERLLSQGARSREQVLRQRGVESRLASVEAGQDSLASGLSALEAAVTVQMSDLGGRVEQAGREAADSGRQVADAGLERLERVLAELQAMRDEQLQAGARLEVLQRQLDEVRTSMDNLFWRRWGRWLRGVGR